jgi:hypothetical protein
MTSVAAARGAPELRLLTRLRAWSVASWRHGDRVALARAACQQLADLAADRESRAPMTVPDHGESALADQLAVLVADAQRAGIPTAQIETIISNLAAGLGVRQ